MYIFRRPIYNNLLKNNINNNNKMRFFSSNINDNLCIIDSKITGVYYLCVTNLFVSVVSLFC
jgi:hypothetical protein